MTEHTLTITMRNGALPLAGECSCGKWRMSFPWDVDKDHRAHVQREADWDAIDVALELAEEQVGSRWTNIAYADAMTAAVEALARLRGRP